MFSLLDPPSASSSGRWPSAGCHFLRPPSAMMLMCSHLDRRRPKSPPTSLLGSLANEMPPEHFYSFNPKREHGGIFVNAPLRIDQSRSKSHSMPSGSGGKRFIDVAVNPPASDAACVKRSRGRPKKSEGDCKPAKLRRPLRATRSNPSRPGESSRPLRPLPQRETCVTKSLPDGLLCANCLAIADPIGQGIDPSNQENRQCLQPWLPHKNSLMEEQ